MLDYHFQRLLYLWSFKSAKQTISLVDWPPPAQAATQGAPLTKARQAQFMFGGAGRAD